MLSFTTMSARPASSALCGCSDARPAATPERRGKGLGAEALEGNRSLPEVRTEVQGADLRRLRGARDQAPRPAR